MKFDSELHRDLWALKRAAEITEQQSIQFARYIAGLTPLKFETLKTPPLPKHIEAALHGIETVFMFRGELADGRRCSIPATNLQAHLKHGGTIDGILLNPALSKKWKLPRLAHTSETKVNIIVPKDAIDHVRRQLKTHTDRIIKGRR